METMPGPNFLTMNLVVSTATSLLTVALLGAVHTVIQIWAKSLQLTPHMERSVAIYSMLLTGGTSLALTLKHLNYVASLGIWHSGMAESMPLLL